MFSECHKAVPSYFYGEMCSKLSRWNYANSARAINPYMGLNIQKGRSFLLLQFASFPVYFCRITPLRRSRAGTLKCALTF